VVIAVPLLVLAVVLGIYPQALFSFMQPSVDLLVSHLTEWSKAAESATAALF
jgi:NADH:ubiquinone oxidoreductase subunit 4 (subunit M)